MKASVFYKHGPPEVLEFDDVEEPAVSNNEVLVKVKACSINHLDLWIRRGLPGVHIEFPRTLGSDASGICSSPHGALQQDHLQVMHFLLIQHPRL